MVDGLKTVVIQSGDLVVAEGATIGNGTDGEVELGKAADKAGHLTINGDMTLAKLKTEDTANTITVASGKTLIVKELTGDKRLLAIRSGWFIKGYRYDIFRPL